MLHLWLVLVTPPVSSVSHTVHMLFSQCVIMVLLYTGTADLQAEVDELKEEDLSSDTDLPTRGGTGDPSSILSESQYTHVHKLFNVTVVLLYTGIDDLADVKRLLKNFNDWQSLGLELGLLYTTLKRIEEEQQRVISKCKTEMLATWLQQQDNVAKKGVPSWSTLKMALMDIDEKKLADSIVIT